MSQTNPSARTAHDASTVKPDRKAQHQARKLLQQAAKAVQKTRQPAVPSGEGVDERIRSIMNDPRYIRGDKDIMQHVRDQFTKAYPGKTKYDATGKMIWPTAVIGPEEVEAFDPDGVLKTPEVKEKKDGDSTGQISVQTYSRAGQAHHDPNEDAESGADNPQTGKTPSSRQIQQVTSAENTAKSGQSLSYEEQNIRIDGETMKFKAAEDIEGQKLSPVFVSPTESGKIRGRDSFGSGAYQASRAFSN